ncbi:Uncharacterised protein [Yersinia pseudotuberculosis]|nr:Uncharacterised protein [Yersinia pseudotuberculosis]CNI88635.1 Uncharacterised protein [Yersinia pseudotuberculosis]CNJ24904.1 Uncharacterised protein [Yersinia pseudotuberculosis]VEE73707.1 Uncharacterised protein [Yersinia pseudotuberculosis]
MMIALYFGGYLYIRRSPEHIVLMVALSNVKFPSWEYCILS